MVETGELLSAEEQVLKALHESLAESEDDLARPMKTLMLSVQDEILENDKCCNRLKTKIKKFLNKVQADCGNELSACLSHVQKGLYQGLDEVEAILVQLSVKCGMLSAGGDLGDLTREPIGDEDKLNYGGTLVLSVKEALPVFQELLIVLREIRDRIPGQPFIAPGETESNVKNDYLIPDEPVPGISLTEEVWDLSDKDTE